MAKSTQYLLFIGMVFCLGNIPSTYAQAQVSHDRVATIAFGSNHPMADQANLENCYARGYQVEGARLILNTDEVDQAQRFFVLQNVSNYTVIVNHQENSHVGASAGWASKIEGGKVSILALNRHPFVLTCIGYNPPHFGAVNCRSVLRVCSYPPQKTSVGSFWLKENFPATEIPQAFKQRNIQLSF